MRYLIGLFAAIFLSCTAAADDQSEIEQVIRDQITAFQQNDLTTAFGFASPAIRNIFRSKENFGAMVRQSYPMIWRPKRYEFLEIVPTEQGKKLTLLIEDHNGARYRAIYDMIKLRDQWCINGVQVLPGGVPSV